MDSIPLRPVAIGAGVGTLAVLAFMGASHLTQAAAGGGPVGALMATVDEVTATHAINPDDLIRIGGRDYTVTTEDSVSLTPVSAITVRKIAFGKATTVTISTTSSGVYSSDAIGSPYVRYPGIHLTAVAGEFTPDAMRLAFWAPQQGWAPAPAFGADSFVSVVTHDGVTTIIRR